MKDFFARIPYYALLIAVAAGPPLIILLILSLSGVTVFTFWKAILSILVWIVLLMLAYGIVIALSTRGASLGGAAPSPEMMVEAEMGEEPFEEIPEMAAEDEYWMEEGVAEERFDEAPEIMEEMESAPSVEMEEESFEDIPKMVAGEVRAEAPAEEELSREEVLEMDISDLLLGSAVPKNGGPRGGDDELSTLSGEEEPEELEEPPEPEKIKKQYINVEFVDKQDDVPLIPGKKYILGIDVDLEIRPKSLVPVVDVSELPPDVFAEEEEVELSFFVTGRNIEVHTREIQKIRVPRNKKSREQARFIIEPLSVGKGSLTVMVLKDNYMLQNLVFDIDIGENVDPVIDTRGYGRGIEASHFVSAREVSLDISRVGDEFEFRFFAKGTIAPDQERFSIRIEELHEWINEARDGIRRIVYSSWEDVGKAYLKRDVKIPKAIADQTLLELAKVGNLLFKRIFLERSQDSEHKLKIGEDLLKLVDKKKTLKIQIMSDHFMLPWGLLYIDTDVDENNVDVNRFLGMSHIIEHMLTMPLEEDLTETSVEIDTREKFSLSLNLNNDLNKKREMVTNLITNQLAYWEKISAASPRVLYRSITDPDDILKTLGEGVDLNHVIYFYCHAKSRTGESQLDFDRSYLQLSGGEKITLAKLKSDAPPGIQLLGYPIVFINACESAEMSPLFYDGFFPYFMAKGARGVIGTECDVPAQFALEWAEGFFDLFLTGLPVGEIFLTLRQQFYEEKNNILGLMYAIYMNGDTKLADKVV
jgi:hypothetical protein